MHYQLVHKYAYKIQIINGLYGLMVKMSTYEAIKERVQNRWEVDTMFRNRP